MSALYPSLVAIIPAVVAALIGVFTYRNQKRTDRWVELRNRRMKEYERYLTAYADWAVWLDKNNSDKEEDEKRRKEYWQAYGSLFQIASDRVLLAVTEFHKVVWMNEPPLTGEAWDEKFKELYATMIFEMRADAFEKSELPKKVVEDRLPFAM
jgi:hypothetical protein